jgi:hypothetical protein
LLTKGALSASLKGKSWWRQPTQPPAVAYFVSELRARKPNTALLGRESAEIQSKEIARVDPFLVKEQALTLTQHSQYLTIQEQYESWTHELQNLSPQFAWVKLHDKPAVKIKTLNVGDPEVDEREVEEVLAEYKRRYQRSREQAEAEMAKISARFSLASKNGTSTVEFFSQRLRDDDRLPR